MKLAKRTRDDEEIRRVLRIRATQRLFDYLIARTTCSVCGCNLAAAAPKEPKL
jgi:hypothetical protein